MTALERLFSEGFRVFFLAAGLYAVIAMGVWEAWLAVQAAGGSLDLPAAPAPEPDAIGGSFHCRSDGAADDLPCQLA